jgi:hypothetical protein
VLWYVRSACVSCLRVLRALCVCVPAFRDVIGSVRGSVWDRV